MLGSMNELGPLAPLLGTWEGNVGLDVSYHYGDADTVETGYFERATFRRIPRVENGQQSMHGLNYQMTAWRHGQEALDPFHDEVGYVLWHEDTGHVMRCFAVPRGIGILAGGHATADATVLQFNADPASPTYGLVQNPHLSDRARILSFDATFTIEDDSTFSYTSDLVIRLHALGGDEMHHTDRNTLHRVG